MASIENEYGTSGPSFRLEWSESSSNNSSVTYYWTLYQISRYKYGSVGACSCTVIIGGEDQGYYNSTDHLEYDWTTGPWSGSSEKKQVMGSGYYTATKKSSSYSLTFAIDGYFPLSSWNNINFTNISESKNQTVPKKNSLTAPTITAGTTIYKPGSDITINWSNAPGSTHKITLEVTDGSVTTTKENITGNLTSTTITGENSKFGAGKTIQARAKSITGSSSTIASSGFGSYVTIGYANAAPSAPNVTVVSNKVEGTSQAKFTVTTDGDSNSGQTLSLYVATSTTGTKYSFSSPLQLSTSNISSYGITTAGTHNLYFYVYDGLEYSSASGPYTITVTLAPQFVGTPSISHTKVKNGSGNEVICINSTINYTMSSQISSPVARVKVRAASTTSGLASATVSTLDTSEYQIGINTIHFDLSSSSPISTDKIPYGYYYQFSFSISDTTAWSEESVWLTYGLRGSLPKTPSSLTVQNDLPTPTSNNNDYFNNKLTCIFTTPTAGTTYADITSIEIVGTTDDGETYTRSGNATEGASNSLDWKLGINAGVKVTIQVKVIDSIGQVSISNFSNTTRIKADSIHFPNDSTNPSISPQEIKPLSNQTDMVIVHPLAYIGTNTTGVTYQYKISYDGKSVAISNVSTTIRDSERVVTVTASDINSLLLENLLSGLSNVKCTVILTVTALDTFGNKDEKTATFVANLTEIPSFASGATFELRHDYNINNSSITTGTGTTLNSGFSTANQQLDVRMFNMGEGVIFVFSEAADANGDIESYTIQVSRNDLISLASIPTDTTSIKNLTYENLVTIPKNDMLLSSNKYYYRYPIPQYQKNQYIYFRVQANDSQGNSSTYLYSNTFMIGCRIAAPKATFGSDVQTERKGTQLTIKFNFNVSDLGGSALGNWDENYYSLMPNLERTFGAYEPSIYLSIEVSDDPTFTSNVTVWCPDKGENGGNRWEGNFIDYGKTSGGSAAKAGEAVIDTGLSETAAPKLYMRFVLHVSYGMSGSNLVYTESIPRVYTYMGITPTIAHRPHKVGINTSTFTVPGETERQAAFVVEDSGSNNYVVFRGVDASDATKTYHIIFDLTTGSMDGANLNGGTW